MSSGASPSREELIAALSRGVSRVGVHAVMFHQVVAEKLGLGATDSRALNILGEMGPLSAGELAEATGLTTGAVTGMVDRLEQGGWVRREADPRDRRKVIIHPVADPDRDRAVEGLFESLGRSFGQLAQKYDERELALVLDFVSSATEMMLAETKKLREQSEPDGG